MFVVAALAAFVAGCSETGSADLTAGGPLWDGASLAGWRPLSGSWSVARGGLLGVGARSRLLREARCPAAYRLRFEVAPHDSAHAPWAVAFPVGDGCLLYKGLFLFAGGPSEWGEAWEAVEIEVRADEIAVSLPGLAQRASEESQAGFADAALARKLRQAGFRCVARRGGLAVLASPVGVWPRNSVSFREGLGLGRACVGEGVSGVALVVPCTAPGEIAVPDSAGARFRAVAVEPL